MQINITLRRQLTKLLPKNYRAIVVARLAAQGKHYHPNTVGNVLKGSVNKEIALELLALAKEESESQKKADELIKAMLPKGS